MIINLIDTIAQNNSNLLGGSNFLSMNHPFFYFLSLLTIGIITYLFSLQQKKKENIFFAKKEILIKRIEIYNELYNLISIASQVTPINDRFYGINIFKKVKDMENWSDSFTIFYSKNWMFFTKETKVAINMMRSFQIAFLPIKKRFSDSELFQFSYEYLPDWIIITDELRNSIEDFFNNKIDLKQKFVELSEQDNKLIEKKCLELNMLKKMNEMKSLHNELY